MKNNREIGDKYEEKAVKLLISRGYKILERNYRVKAGEIDIIAKFEDTIVFIEVKYRKTLKYGYGLEAVDYRKIRRIYNAAKVYLTLNKKLSSKIRFDCISFLGDNNPLLHLDNCIITPHISWAAKESRQRIMDITVENVKAFLEGNPIHVVNMGK